MSWRGVVGRVTPTQTSKATDELRTLLPDGIRIDEIRLNITQGIIEEFRSPLPLYTKRISVSSRGKALTLFKPPVRRRSCCAAIAVSRNL